MFIISFFILFCSKIWSEVGDAVTVGSMKVFLYYMANGVQEHRAVLLHQPTLSCCSQVASWNPSLSVVRHE